MELHDTVERRAEELAGEQRALREDRIAHEAEAREMARRAVSYDKQLAQATLHAVTLPSTPSTVPAIYLSRMPWRMRREVIVWCVVCGVYV